MPDLPVLDPQPLRDLVELVGSDDLVQELIGLFREDVPPHLALLKAALTTGNAANTAGEAHGLKGSLGNLGLQHFAALAARIETCATEGQMAEAARIGELLTAAYDEADRALSTAFPKA